MTAESKLNTSEVELPENELRKVSHELYTKLVKHLSGNLDFEKALVSGFFGGKLSFDHSARLNFKTATHNHSLFLYQPGHGDSITLARVEKGSEDDGYERIEINPLNHTQSTLLGIGYEIWNRGDGAVVRRNNSQEAASKIRKFIKSI